MDESHAEVKLDIKNKKIIYELDKDARQSFSVLAKKVGLSKEVVNYRVKHLIKSGIIRKFITVINVSKLGYNSFRVYLRYQNVDPEKEQQIIGYFVKHPNVFWSGSLSGGWDLEILIFARNFYHYTNIMEGIVKDIGNYIKESSLSMALFNYHFKRRHLVEKKEEVPTALYGGEPENISIDETDYKILSLLSQNARAGNAELAKDIGIVANAVKYRIKKLTKGGIIQTYRLWLDTHKMGFELYKAIIKSNSMDRKREGQMVSFCKTIPSILYFIRCGGSWNLEIEAEVIKNEDFRDIMMAFRKQFNDIIQDFQILLIFAEHKINYFPMDIKDIIQK